MAKIQPYLPKSNSISDAVYTYLVAERIVLEDLKVVASTWAANHLGPDWFDQVKFQKGIYGLEGWDNPLDAFYLLKGIAQIPHSLIRHSLGPSQEIRPLARNVFQNRNKWSHFSNSVLPSEIRKDLNDLVVFAKRCGLDSADGVHGALEQLRALTVPTPGGPPPVPVVSPTQPVGTAAAEGDEEKIPTRPRIGDPWTDEFPTEVWEVSTKLRDVRARATGESMRSQWPDEDAASFAIERLLRCNLSPQLLYVDPRDGAMLGFVEGHPFFVGYLGPVNEPRGPEFRGFAEPVRMEFLGGDFVWVGSGSPALADWDGRGQLVDRLVETAVPEGSQMELTNYGDVVLLGEAGRRRLVTVSSGVMRDHWVKASS